MRVWSLLKISNRAVGGKISDGAMEAAETIVS